MKTNFKRSYKGQERGMWYVFPLSGRAETAGIFLFFVLLKPIGGRCPGVEILMFENGHFSKF